ncbi:hypothetical protein ACFYO5_14865 [Streptomyces sp. NPDC006259]|uniref:hypothetical protein n=1 Tax=Streptomyces sp. NPDC006259 TaxID=3364740 RepID=UPI00368C20AA
MTTTETPHDPGPRTVPEPAEPAASPAPSTRRRALGGAVTILGGAALVWLGTLAAMWFLPFLVGAAAGVVSRVTPGGRPRGYLAASCAAVLGWALPLAVQALDGAPVGAVARTTAALAGLPPLAAVAFGLTFLVAVVQALSGAWLGRTVVPRRLSRTTPAPAVTTV